MLPPWLREVTKDSRLILPQTEKPRWTSEPLPTTSVGRPVEEDPTKDVTRTDVPRDLPREEIGGKADVEEVIKPSTLPFRTW